mmetsp:Transcript_10207/g.41263  ORF Transcript_10207/g.41263 Transcript_10207/m.41263 type:complete len:226 (-) Transcript_10207:977-1654(-)
MTRRLLRQRRRVPSLHVTSPRRLAGHAAPRAVPASQRTSRAVMPRDRPRRRAPPRLLPRLVPPENPLHLERASRQHRRLPCLANLPVRISRQELVRLERPVRLAVTLVHRPGEQHRLRPRLAARPPLLRDVLVLPTNDDVPSARRYGLYGLVSAPPVAFSRRRRLVVVLVANLHHASVRPERQIVPRRRLVQLPQAQPRPVTPRVSPQRRLEIRLGRVELAEAGA